MTTSIQEELLTTDTIKTVQNPPSLHVTWQDYEVMVEQLARKIYESDWKFDQIVCIARGGMFVGDSLSRIFNKPLAVIFSSSYKNDKEQDRLIISKHIAMTTDKLGKHILLVDDLVDTGVTMAAVKRLLADDPEVNEVRTAVLWYKKCSEITPDYFAKVSPDKVWIYQPFEYWENKKLEDRFKKS
jgi:hypoxanthine phosphoribosyltransferase